MPETIKSLTEPRELPLLPLKNSVLFPGLLLPLAVGRAGSVAAVEAALASEEKELILVAPQNFGRDIRLTSVHRSLSHGVVDRKSVV